MSTIYSAGQYDDAFTPKKLGNWESTAKESYPFRKTPKLFTPKIIVDQRGHLLPWIPRSDRSTAWGLLNLHLRNKYNRNKIVFMSGPGKTSNNTGPSSGTSTSPIQKRLKKLPRFAPRRIDNSPPPDLLLEYLQHLRLPIIWIIGPATKMTFSKRKQFSKQLASNLQFGYVNLDEKIQEWKERQQICTCTSGCGVSSTGIPPCHGPLHSLASTSIAPSKLPTSVPPFISPNIPSPPQSSSSSRGPSGDANDYLLNILESQRITFDTALPIERNKILELYKFAMAECLPCDGFIMDSVPFDLVEGLQFEKVFYPTALAIYFTEGAPKTNKKVKPKDRRVTASSCSSGLGGGPSAGPVKMSPIDYLEKSHRKMGENLYLKPKSHRRLGLFSLTEGDKICKQFGGKTIRIINAEDVERDTMEFLNELVKRNLDKYQEILEGKVKLDVGGIEGGGELIPRSSSSNPVVPRRTSASSMYSGGFLLEEEEKLLEWRERQEKMRRKKFGGKDIVAPVICHDQTQAPANMPPALITAHQSETSLFTIPNIFSDASLSSEASSLASSSVEVTPRDGFVEDKVVIIEEEEEEEEPVVVKAEVNDKPSSREPDTGGAGDFTAGGGASKVLCKVPKDRSSRSAELWERIVKLESKVAELKTPEEEDLKLPVIQVPEDKDVRYIPPPTAYLEDGEEASDKEEDEKYTAAIRNAIGPNYVAAALASQSQSQQVQAQAPYPYHPSLYHDHLHQSQGQYPDYDYGASGDCGYPNEDLQQQQQHQQQQFLHPPNPSQYLQQKKSPPQSSPPNQNGYQHDPFYDDY